MTYAFFDVRTLRKMKHFKITETVFRLVFILSLGLNVAPLTDKVHKLSNKGSAIKDLSELHSR